jgi:hypothetical protein
LACRGSVFGSLKKRPYENYATPILPVIYANISIDSEATIKKSKPFLNF